jgi:putative inorganic carbon (hco3(-)) transporter
LPQDLGGRLLAASVQPFCTLLRIPSLLYLAMFTVFLFRPPDLELHQLDRIAFAVLFIILLMRASVLKQKLPWLTSVSAPMIALLLLSVYAPLTEPFNAQTWSLFAAKFLVPFTLFHLAQLVFCGERSFRHFELFSWVLLAYLSLISLASVLGMNWLIYPKYILDEGVGIHADRARGPFLQAVANGMTLNMLALFAVDSWRRRRLRGVFSIVLLVVPMAILATMTRAVWLSFAGSLLALLVLTRDSRVQRACAGLALGAVVGLIFALSIVGCRLALQDRLEERSPVEFRFSIYEVSWEMASEKPWLGWGQNQMPAEIAKRMSDYRPDTYCAHNSYLEILIEQGLIGLALYTWMIIGLLRMGIPRAGNDIGKKNVDRDLQRIWPIVLGAYLLNASFVVVNYQFVNALLFTIGGIVAAQQTQSRHALGS